MSMKVQVSKLLVLLFIGIFLLSAVSMVNALGVTTTIPVGRAPSGLAYDSAKGEIFVSNGQDNTTSVISDSTNTVIATIPVGGYPDGVAYDSAKGEIFVVNLYSNSVSVMSDTTNTVVATIPVGESPYNIAYDSAKGELFVTNSYDSTVSVISDNTNTVVATIPVGTEPFGIAYDSGKGEIFVGNEETDTRNYSLSVISDITNTVVETVTLPNGTGFLAYDSGKGEIFVSGYQSFVVVSDSTNAVVATIPISNLNYEPQVEGIAYDPGRNLIFVALQQSNKVVAISDSTNKVVETITVSHSPWEVTYDSGNGAIYVTCGAESGNNTVSVISGPSSTSTTPTPGSFDFGSIIWIIVIIIIIILLIIIILIWLSRQRKFTVTVQNSQTQSPITGATVFVSGQQDLSGTTNNKGQTVFGDFKDGDYSIKASATGYIASMPISVSVKNKTEVVIKLNPVPSEGTKVDSNGSGPDNQGKATTVEAMETQQTQAPAQSASILTTTPPPPSPHEPAEPQGWRDEKIQQIIQKFQEKGAISPQTAMTAKELGLSRIFVRIMERRKDQTKMFVEVNGKYYLDQLALEEKKQ